MTFLCFYSNGSVIPRVLIKIDAQAQISQWQLVEFMNETLKSSMLGKYQVDPTSVELTGINFAYFFFFCRWAPPYFFPVSLHYSSQFTDWSLVITSGVGGFWLCHNQINLISLPPLLGLSSILMIPLIGCQLSVVPPLYSVSNNWSPHHPPWKSYDPSKILWPLPKGIDYDWFLIPHFFWRKLLKFLL